MKILYISYDGMTDPLGQSQVLPYLAGLSALGHEIHLVSCEKPEKYDPNKKEIELLSKTAGIRWYPITYSKNPPVLSTLYDLFRIKKKAIEICKHHSIEIIHCRSYLPALVGLQLKKRFSLQLLFDMRGFWVDERVEGGIWKLSNPLYRIIYNYLKKKEKTLLISSEAIVSLTQKACPIIHELQGEILTRQILQVIPCCADSIHFDPNNINEASRLALSLSLGISNSTFVLSYLGGIGTWYLPSEMMDFYARLLIKYPEAVFLFITQEEADPLYKMAKEKGISTSSIIVRKASRKEVPLYLSLSNASLFFIKPSFSKQASSPTKQGELMCMGIPIICNKGIGDTDNILYESDTGSVCETFTNKEYDRIIQSLNLNITDERKNKIREASIHYFSLEKGIKAYDDIYRQLAHE